MATFDYAAAKQAGYSDDEINTFLSASKLDSTSRPQGLIPSSPAAPSATAAIRPRPAAPSGGREMLRPLVNALPMLGGTIGAALGLGGGTILGAGVGGVPAAMGLAGLGGMGGEAARQVLNQLLFGEVTQNPAARIQSAFPGQAIPTLAGEPIASGMGKAARGIGRLALRPTAKEAERELLRPGQPMEVGQNVETMLREKIPVGQLGKATERLESSVAARDASLFSRAAQKAKFNAMDHRIMDNLDALTHEGGAAEADPVAFRNQIREWRQNFIDERRLPGGPGRPGKLKQLSAKDMDEIRRIYQQKAAPLYEARKKGVLDETQATKLRFYEAIANGASKALDETVPGYKSIQSRSQSLMGLREGLASAQARGPRIPLWAQGAIGAGGYAAPDVLGSKGADAAAALILSRALASPQALSRIALMLNEPLAQATAGQVPRALSPWIEDALGRRSQPQP